MMESEGSWSLTLLGVEFAVENCLDHREANAATKGWGLRDAASGGDSTEPVT